MEVEKIYNRNYRLKNGTFKEYKQKVKYINTGNIGRPKREIPEDIQERFSELIQNRRNKKSQIIKIIFDEFEYKITEHIYRTLYNKFTNNN